WYAYEQAAVYNAVVGITRRFELYRWSQLGPTSASPQAAAAVAAHDVLLEYFPGSATRLTDALTASLGAIPDGAAKDAGIAYGEQAAARIIQLRADDGRFGDVTFDEPEGPGVWRPTPPTFTPFFDPWLSELEPFIMKSPSQFRPEPPPGLKSDVYTREYREVKRLGSLTSKDRTDEQTQTALFFSDTGIGPLQAGLRDTVTRLGLDISESARVFAAVDLSIADAVIGAWNAKLHYHWWRPMTAIQMSNTDGNPNTKRDANWQPFLVNPPYPDYPSGLCNVMGAATRALAGVLGLGRGVIDLKLTSAAAGETRHYTSKTQLMREAIDARVWSGLHFRTADRVAAEMGTLVARRATNNYFQPT
ncbi:MAG TPA: vanadium-dependent haloperoxidase, partial [Actinomycetota bacterium]|nr:vanadium-dependent haloperoxidase [Actinomycetota bacterium]